ncbi:MULTISPECIES: ABC transporter substrate-binding protein [unclassified Haladaptatus]|uniref:ABC transporter substrate-binding protein n=1 Tax=unclassified Haladaptatus TaxID=2622732 RepID=UPI0023E86182|nr:MULTISPECIES: ABC transporter substrate-binding protein [unclassified Haladaptatus]
MRQTTDPQDQSDSYQTRRRFMQAAAAAGLVTVAGCTGGNGGGDGGANALTIPGLYDQSGATSDVGRPTALGSRDAFKWINEEGLLEQQINHNGVDYAYDVAQAQQNYDEFTSGDLPPIIIGWGTADTEALSQRVARDEIVYISASYSANLLTEEAPYNFFGNLDYTSQARAHLKWIADNDPGKIAFIFSNNPFGKAPVEGGKAYAEELGLEVGDDIDLPLTANSATSQLRKARDDSIDYLIHQNTAAPMQVLLKDRQDVYPEVNVMGLTYTVDELRVQESPETFEGVRYVSGFKTFGEVMEGSGDGKAAIEASFEREGRDMNDPSVANLNYVRGVIHAMLALKGIQEANNLDLDPSAGANIREGLFETQDWDVFGLAEPFSYEEADRRPTMTGRIYQVEGGEMKFDSKAELPRRDDWIGL